MNARLVFLQTVLVIAAALGGCGGGSGSTPPPPPAPPKTYSAISGVAQKGPLIVGSTVTALELDATLSPIGKQYSYQTTSDLGTFNPNSIFNSQYMGVNATGYYFDEVANSISSGQVTLNGYSDLSSTSVLNVNLLTTLAYQRIQTLVTKSNLTFAAAQTQGENEVLAALNILHGSSYGTFSTLDISNSSDGGKILAAISSLFVYGNTAGNLSALIAAFQNDISANGTITNAATRAALAAAAKALDPSAIAANLTAKYSSVGDQFSATDITNWIDKDGDGLVGKFKFQVPDANQSSVFSLPTAVTDPFAGTQITTTTGQLSVNGSAVFGAVTTKAGDVLAVTPPASGVFPNGVLTAYLTSGTGKIGRVTFVRGLNLIAVTPASLSVQVGATLQLTAIGTFSDGSTADLTNSVHWSSNAPSVTTVNATTGVVAGVAAGSATITASSGSVSGNVALSVVPAALVSIAVTPNPFTTGVGIPRQLTAAGTYSDNTTADLTSSVTWVASDPTVLNVTGGIASGLKLGTTNIVASVGAISGISSVTVTSNTWSPAANLSYPFNPPNATALANGKVLVVGPSIAGPGAEIYDPVSNAFSILAPPPITGGLAVLLTSGKVLLMEGGASATYDPTTNTWTSAGTPPYSGGTAPIVLQNGKVLVIGGQKTEIYDPNTNSWSTAASMIAARSGFTATLLPNGKVLVAGGDSSTVPPGFAQPATAEVYDLASDSWSQTGVMTAPRIWHTATVLANGKILVAAGELYTQIPLITALSSTEIYDSATNTWSAAGNMNFARYHHTATTWSNGRVFVLGGYLGVASAEIYDPTSDTWSVAAGMPDSRYLYGFALLGNNELLVVGTGGGVNPSAAYTCVVYW